MSNEPTRWSVRLEGIPPNEQGYKPTTVPFLRITGEQSSGRDCRCWGYGARDQIHGGR
jgi:hypothetical protein